MIFGAVALAVSLLLLVPLLGLAKVDLGATLRILGAAKPVWLAAVVVLTAVNVLLAAAKWRTANVFAGAAPPAWPTAFSLTAVGVGLGQALPVQVATATARALGARALGQGTMLRAGATSLLEQAFDVAIYGAVALVSVATLMLRGGEVLWLVLAALVLGGGWLLAGHAMRWSAGGGGWLLRRLGREKTAPRLRATLAALERPDDRFARRLVLLSAARFITLVALATALTLAVGLAVSPWQLAAALPFAVIAIALVATPAGLGVNEWAMSGALFAFGVTMHTAVQWVVLSRVLSTGASVLVGGVGALLAVLQWRGPAS